MSAFGTPKKVPRPTKKLTDEMLQGYRDNDGSELYRDIKAGHRFDGTDTTITELRLYRNQTTDVSALAQVLPQTQITILGLERNQIADVSALAQVLPQTKITLLDVSGLDPDALATPYLDARWPRSENKISDAGKAELMTVKKNKDGKDINIKI